MRYEASSKPDPYSAKYFELVARCIHIKQGEKKAQKELRSHLRDVFVDLYYDLKAV